MKKAPYRLYLSEEEIPKKWYNLRADMKELPEPMINPATMKPALEEDLYPVFCKELAHQEMDDKTRYVDIPEEVREMYKIYRPSPLCRAYNLEKALGTPAKIYYKFEGNNTSGSHKLNSAIAQAYYAKKEGLKGVTTETGAGQWGTALSEACSYFGLPLNVYMVKVSYEQKPDRKNIMKVFGADVTPSPSNTTNAGRKILEQNPDDPGSLGTAISEAVEVAVSTDGYRYVLGSVLNQVLNEAIAIVQPPTDKGKRLKIFYMTQASTKPPTFVVFVNDKQLFHFSYERYLVNQLRKEFVLTGTPIRIIVREKRDKD